MADEDVQAQLEKLQKENETLKAQAQAKARAGSLALKVSEKGAVSVYGLGRFPVTLYQEQWGKLLEATDDIRAFIKANEGQLKKKEV